MSDQLRFVFILRCITYSHSSGPCSLCRPSVRWCWLEPLPLGIGCLTSPMYPPLPSPWAWDALSGIRVLGYDVLCFVLMYFKTTAFILIKIRSHFFSFLICYNYFVFPCNSCLPFPYSKYNYPSLSAVQFISIFRLLFSPSLTSFHLLFDSIKLQLTFWNYVCTIKWYNQLIFLTHLLFIFLLLSLTLLDFLVFPFKVSYPQCFPLSGFIHHLPSCHDPCSPTLPVCLFVQVPHRDAGLWLPNHCHRAHGAGHPGVHWPQGARKFRQQGGAGTALLLPLLSLVSWKVPEVYQQVRRRRWQPQVSNYF